MPATTGLGDGPRARDGLARDGEDRGRRDDAQAIQLTCEPLIVPSRIWRAIRRIRFRTADSSGLHPRDGGKPMPLGGMHVLRHTFCSHLAMRGTPTSAMQEVAGVR